MSKLPQQLNVLQTPSVHQQVLHCDFCGGDHVTSHCSMPTNTQAEEVQQPPYQSSYQQGPHSPLHERPTKLEEILEKFMQVSISNQKNTYVVRPSKKDKVRQYARFLDLFKNLQINIPFMEAREQMHVYAKFMKDLLTKESKFSEETVTLEAGCSAIIQKSLPQKTKVPASFIIPVTIGELSEGKALLDLGASIKLIPLSMLKRIGGLEIKPTRMTLQLADRYVKYPYGVLEDVSLKVDELVFPVDFVIMDIEEDKEVPLIFGRPFMKTARVIIDVDDGKLKVRVEDQDVNFNVFEAMKHLKDKQHCFRVDVIEDLFMLDDIHLSRSSHLEKVLSGDLEGNSKTCLVEAS
ncbi:PREDICTED: uncharacterized protein LOC109338740 [Lupinus angustifolius]|uniref:uncharacterized protein LOC109338740 n=1 Tax=Lupinus angustifolius TaxID=3871 RepID=UPI00092EC456|nr:PREDICTED: uncharacterized protein LOC109338740 [Lupinus angustifolius]